MERRFSCAAALAAAVCFGIVVLAGGCSSQRKASVVSAEASVRPSEMRPQAAELPEGHVTQVLDPIDLTDGTVAVFNTCEPEILDTRTFDPQFQASEHWTGEIRPTKVVRPRHKKLPKPPQADENGLPVGGVLDEIRTRPDMQFPTVSQTPWNPPDPTMAVGPSHVVVTVNMVIAFYTKSGTQTFSANLDSTGNPGFFEPVGGGTFCFDPKCYYDHYSNRFIVIALETYGSTEAYIDIAISDDSDPNGIWYKYRTNAVISSGSNTYWVDYPGVGFDENAWYVTGNLFGLNNGGFGGALFRSFQKSTMLSGGPAVFADLRDSNGASVQVAHHFGSPQAAYFASISSTAALKIYAVRNVLTSPTLTSTTVTVPNFAYPTSGAPNPGGSLDVLGDRLMNVCWRNGKLYTAHTVLSGGRNMARWDQLLTNDWPNSGSVTSAMSGTVDAGSGTHTFFPAVYANKYDDVGMVMAETTASTLPAIFVAGRKVTDPAGTMGVPTQVAIGTSGGSGRWGDYFGVGVDPNDDATFWLVGEYANSGGWVTWVSSFQVTTCPPPVITQQPVAQEACPGHPVTFSVVTSAPAPTYQWRRGATNLVNGPNITGATTANLTILSPSSADLATDYNCLVTSAGCTGATFGVGLTLTDPPVIQTQPANTTVMAGEPAVFRVATTEQSVLFTYQWRMNGVDLEDGGDIGGAHAALLVILNADESDEGSYDCRVTRVLNDCDVTSVAATLTVDTPLTCPHPAIGCDTADIYPTDAPDCVVDLSDLGTLLANYSPGAGGKSRSQGDIYPLGGGDGFVDLSDLGQLLAVYGTDCR